MSKKSGTKYIREQNLIQMEKNVIKQMQNLFLIEQDMSQK